MAPTTALWHQLPPYGTNHSPVAPTIASVTSYKFEPIAVAENKNTKPTNVTSYKFVMFASYKFEIIAVAGTTNTKHTSATSSEFVTNTSMTSSKFITFAMNKYKKPTSG